MTITDFIKQGEDLKASIIGVKLKKDKDYKIWIETVLRFLNKEIPGDMAIERFQKQVNRFNPNYCYKDEFDNILSVLKGVEALPERTLDTSSFSSKKGKDSGININNNLTQNQEQHQNQHQSVIVNILLDAVKDELTGRQRKEVLEIAKNSATPEEARKSILEKLKEFGMDVSASIVANILTNPNVWSTLSALL